MITPIYAFSHNYLINDWEKILGNQLKLINESGLYKVITSLIMFAYGDDDNFNIFNRKIEQFDNLYKIRIRRIKDNLYEYPTIQALQEFSKIENAYILYFHLKGVWSTSNNNLNAKAIESWRDCLEYFNIEKWKDCVQKLDEGYEVVGALYNYNTIEPLFSGNFWWANTQYLRRLPELVFNPDSNPDKDKLGDDGITWVRVECEKWINKIPNKYFNFYIPKDYGFYYVPLEKEHYKKTHIEHIYQNIEGWFDFESIYKEMVEISPDNSHFVEVGAWLGKSTSYLAVEIANSKKNIKFDAVDTWVGSDEEVHKKIIDELGMSLLDKFLSNMAPVINYVNPVIGYSEIIADTYQDESLDFVFLDGAHDYESVKKDIEKWYPKVKKDGVIAGHDYNESGIEGTEWEGVVRAVDEFFGKDNIEVRKVHAGTWIVRKNQFEKRKSYKVSVLIPTYNRFNLLKEAIESVLIQKHKNIEILVCHDGESEEYNTFKENNKHPNIFYYEIEKRNNYGAAQRNFLLDKVTGDFIVHLDDDNILYPDYLEKMLAKADDNTGMVISRIHYNDKEWYNYVLPLSDKIQECEIDQLGILFRADIGKMFKWDDYFGHDHRYIRNCESVITQKGYSIKYIPDDIANHRFFGQVIPRVTVIIHCYLVNNWKSIFENQIFLMKKYGLYDNSTEIISTVYAEDKRNYTEFSALIEKEDNLKKWKFIEIKSNNYEFDALRLIKKYSENKHAYVCYFHLKGVFSEQIQDNSGVPTWRQYLNYFTINKWRENIEKLKSHDIVCVDWNYNDMHQKKVVGGNFFWVTSEYIRTLPEPRANDNRFLLETWITSNNDVKVYENFNYEKIGYKNLYMQYFDPSLYRNDIEIEIDNISRIKDEAVYIITSHPNYKMSEDITIKTVSNLKSFGEKVLLSSHCPVSIKLQELSDYLVFDKNNPIIKHDFYTNSWFTENEYFAHLNITKLDNNTNHALGVFLNYYNSIIMAKNLGFTTAVCTNFDMVFSSTDKKIIDDRIHQMRTKGKKAFFLNTPQTEGIHYKTIFFITDVDYFLNTFKYIIDESTYMDEMKKVESNTNCLENFFYHSLKMKTNDLLLEEINEGELFSTSEINLFSLIEYNTILPVENERDKFVYWFSSANSLDSRELRVHIRKNGKDIYQHRSKINKKFVFYKKIKYTLGDIFEINTQIFDNEELLKDKTIIVNYMVFNDLTSYGKFIDKINIDYI